MRKVLATALTIALVLGCKGSGNEKKRAVPVKKTQKKEVKKVKAAKKKAQKPLDFDPKEVQKVLSEFASVEITVDEKKLTDKQKKALHFLILAADVMDRLFWQQAGPNCLKVKKEVEEKAKKDPRYKPLLKLIEIMAGPYNRLEDFKPFYGHYKKPLGATFYPLDMTKTEFNTFLANHPEQKEAFLSPVTVIRRRGGKLVAVPYSEEYRDLLTKAAHYLRMAASYVDNKSLKKFLLSRADAFITNKYFQSELDWMDVQGAPIEVTIGPYEVYEDRLFNYKAAFEAFIGVVDEASTKKMAMVKAHLKEIEDNLPVEDQYKGKGRKMGSPIKVIDLIIASGDAHKGVQTLAYNLPNDEHVRKVKGSKKVLLKNVSEAKFREILLPIAARLLPKDGLQKVSFDAYFNHTLMHEISHGVGPGFIKKADGSTTTVNLALKEAYSTIEEAKADVLGQYNTLFFIDKGYLPKTMRQTTMWTYLAGIFRSVRFGVSEAHGRANMIQYNYLKEFGAFQFDPKTKKFSVNEEKFATGIKNLAHDLLMIEAKGDYKKAKEFIAKYGIVPPEVKEALASLGGIPVDIWPTYTLANRLRVMEVSEATPSKGQQQKSNKATTKQ